MLLLPYIIRGEKVLHKKAGNNLTTEIFLIEKLHPSKISQIFNAVLG